MPKDPENTWNFIAFTFDQATTMGTFVVNEIFGYEGLNGSNRFFMAEVFSNWLKEAAMKSNARIGSAKFQNGNDNFHGFMSCMQFFPKLMTPSQIYHLSKVCHVREIYPRRKVCPPNYYDIEDKCLRLSDMPMTYSQAELACTPLPDENRMSHLATPSSYLMQEILSHKANKLLEVDEIWIGLDSQSGEIHVIFKSLDWFLFLKVHSSGKVWINSQGRIMDEMNWAKGFPTANKSEACAVLSFSNNGCV